MALSKEYRRNRIKMRVRKNVNGTTMEPRLSVFRSNKSIYAQLIDDTLGTTLLAASSNDKNLKVKGTKIEQANIVGKTLAERAISLGIKQCVFDRNGYLYHGRIKAVAEAVREKGIKI